MKPILINIYGAPGAGKSTLAAKIFSILKEKNVECELVTEFAKDMIWENADVFENQIFLFGNQFRRIERLLGFVDVIITDSPIDIAKVYVNDSIPYKKSILNLIDDVDIEFINENFDRYDFLLNFDTKYSEIGRNETITESIALRKRFLELREYDDIIYNKDSIEIFVKNLVETVVSKVIGE